MTHGEAYWCVKRFSREYHRTDWLCSASPNVTEIINGGKWGLWISRDRFHTLAGAEEARWRYVDVWSNCSLTVVRVTHRRKGT